MTFVTDGLVVAALSLIGVTLLSLIAPANRLWGVQRLAIGYLLGSGSATVFLFMLSPVLGEDTLVVLLATVLAAAVLSVWHGRYELISRARQLRTLNRQSLTTREWLMGSILAVFCAIIILTTLESGLGHDGRTIWGLRSKMIFVMGEIPQQAELGRLQPERTSYPPLVPALEALVYAAGGRVDEKAAKTIFVGFSLSLLALFWTAVRRHYSRVHTILFLTLLWVTPIWALSSISGYVDMPLATFVFAAFICIMNWRRSEERSDLLLAAIMMGLAVWLKREGLVFWCAMSLIVVVMTWRVSRGRWFLQSGLFIGASAIVALPWLVYLQINGATNVDFGTISWQTTMANLSRLPTITAYLLRLWFVGLASWGLMWLVFWSFLLRGKRLLDSTEKAVSWSLTVLPGLALTYAFLYSTYSSFEVHMQVSLDRLWVQAAPLAWYFIAVQISELKSFLPSIQRNRLPQHRRRFAAGHVVERKE